MAIRDRMYKEVQLWKASDQKKSDFIKGKNYSKSKFEYWIGQYNEEYNKPAKSNFKEIPIKESVVFPKVEIEKTLQIELPSGIKITIYK